MKFVQYICLAVLAAALLLPVGCAQNVGGSTYRANQVQQSQSVQYGTVTGVRGVTIESNSDGTVGAVGGGVAGGVLGSMLGRGRGHGVGAVVGALAGAGIGYASEKALTTQNGLEIEIQLESNGQIVSIVQGADESFAVGDRVRVLYGWDNSARVTH